MQTQIEKITSILCEEGKIDNFRAIREMITLRLGARIYDLERQGWKFKKYYANPNRTNFVYEVERKPNEH